MLLLLRAQPLVRVVDLPTRVIDDSDTGISITLGRHPTDVPSRSPRSYAKHLASRPHLRTGAGPDSPWLFPSSPAGRNLTPTPCWTDSATSASTSWAPATEPSASSSSNAHPRSSPNPSAKARWQAARQTRPPSLELPDRLCPARNHPVILGPWSRIASGV